MEITANNAYSAFVTTTKALLAEEKIYCLHLQFPATQKDTSDDRLLGAAFDAAFTGKDKQKGGAILPWRKWLINSGFPDILYKEHGNSLMETILDPRISEQNFQSKSSHHNFFGRLCRPLIQHHGKTYMHYLLERWKRGSGYRSQPNFYFDIERPEWIWEELIKNGEQIKTGRSGATCATNMFFRWDTSNNRPIVGWILKHCHYSHFYQDVYSPQLIARAICKEVGIECNAVISVFFVSIFMDAKKNAKQLLLNLENATLDLQEDK
jgi:hypothetical protein